MIEPQNPYIGPLPFPYGKKLYGRARESRELKQRLMSERILLMYSPSGAGKSSLINASLVQNLLNEQFDVLKVVRLNASTSGPNRYVASTLECLAQCPDWIDQSSWVEPSYPMETTLSQALAVLSESRPEVEHKVLIFDQFEEIITLDPLDCQAKEQFFEQLGELLEERKRNVWALFAMREEYVATLDPFSPILPTGFSATFRLDLLLRGDAHLAIANPCKDAMVDFSEEAIDVILNDLCRIRIHSPNSQASPISGSTVTPVYQQGRYIEPLQLQVICSRVWSRVLDRMSSDDIASTQISISVDDVRSAGGVDDALAAYYDSQIAKISTNINTETQLRTWFDTRLITSSRTRAVATVAEQEEKIGEKMIRALVDSHLVRREDRHGAPWFELAHDRLIEPILECNQAWRKSHLNLFQQRALLWNQNHSDDLLLSGLPLVRSIAWVLSQNESLSRYERTFFRKSVRQMGMTAVSLLLVTGLVVALGKVAVQSYIDARLRQEAARAEFQLATSLFGQGEESEALLHVADAIASAPDDQGFRLAVRNAAFSKIKELSLRPGKPVGGSTIIQPDTPPLSSAAFSPTGDRMWIIRGEYQSSGTYSTYQLWNVNDGSVLSELPDVSFARFSSNGQQVITVKSSGEAQIWDAATAHLVTDFQTAGLSTLSKGSNDVCDLSPDLTRVVTISPSSKGSCVTLWSFGPGEPSHRVLTDTPAYLVFTRFNLDGTAVITVSESGVVSLFDTMSGKLKRTYQTGIDEVSRVALSYDGTEVAIGGRDMAQVWNIPGGCRLCTVPTLGNVTDLAISPSGKLVATATALGARCWTIGVADGSPILKRKGTIENIAFSPNSRLIATTEGSRVRIWSALSSELLGSSPVLGGPVCYSAFSRDGRQLLVVSKDGTAWIWKVADDSAGASCSGRFLSASYLPPDGRRIVTVGLADQDTSTGDNVARLWSADFSELGKIPHIQSAIVSVSPDGKRIVAIGPSPYDVQLWDVTATPRRVSTLHLNEIVGSATFSPDGGQIAIVSQGGLSLWNGVEGNGPHVLPGLVQSVSFSPDGMMFVTVMDDGVKVWNRDNYAHWSVPADQVRWVSFDGRGDRLAVAIADRGFEVWDLKQKRLISQGRCPSIQLAALSKDGRQLASVSNDPSGDCYWGQIWNADNAEFLSPRLPHGKVINSVEFSPDSRLVMTTCQDGQVRLWGACSADDVREQVDGRLLLSLRSDGPAQSAMFKPDSGSEPSTILTLAGAPGQTNHLGQHSSDRVQIWTVIPPTEAPEVIKRNIENKTGLILDKRKMASFQKSQE